MVQFSTDVFYCAESDGVIEVDIVRIGDASNLVSAEYVTESGAAVNGVHFVGSSGSVVFTPNE